MISLSIDDITFRYFADLRDRWARSHGFARCHVSIHNDVGSLSVGHPDNPGHATIWATGANVEEVVVGLVRGMLDDLGERGDYSAALEASIDAARAQREREASTPATEGT